MDAHPHTRQLLRDPTLREAAAAALKRGPVEQVAHRVLDDECRRMKFRDRPQHLRSTLHLGQLKLLVADIIAILEVTNSPDYATSPGHPISSSLAPTTALHNILCVVAGGAQGPHFAAFIGDAQGQPWFPHVTFHFYDPVRYHDHLHRAVEWANRQPGRADNPARQHQLHNCFFTDAIADKYAAMRVAQARDGTRLLFLSDIRSQGKPSRAGLAQADKGVSEVEGYVQKDMDAQAAWVRIMRPTLSVLKFRLPWKKGATRYLNGRIHIQAFAPVTSTETRLHVSEADAKGALVEYDHIDYEEKMMRHNMFERALVYRRPEGAPRAESWSPAGLDGCWDCTRLLEVLLDLQKFAERYLPLCYAESQEAWAVPQLYRRAMSRLSRDTARTLAK